MAARNWPTYRGSRATEAGNENFTGSSQERGGDVDIFVEADSADVMRRIRCKTLLTELFDLKVDLVVGNGDKPIHRIAKSTGVRLK